MTSRRLCVLCPIVAVILALLLMLCAPPSALAQALPDPKKPVSFMEHVAPLLRENCFACHNPKVRKGKFDMSTFEGLKKGGDKGETFTEGKPEESNLFLVMSGDLKPDMPPKEAGGLLAKEKAAVIERWIKEGAKFDGPAADSDIALELRKRWKPPTPPAAYKFPSIVNAIAFTPDNKKLVTGGYYELLVWDIATAKLEKRIRTRAERAMAMAFIQEGKTLAVAGGRPGQEGDVRLYNIDAANPKEANGVKLYDGLDLKAGCLIRELVQIDDQMLCLAVSDDGKQLAAGGCDRTTRVWNVDDEFKLDQTIENHADWVLGVAFAPDGKQLLTAGKDKTAKVWDLAAKENVQTFGDHQNEVWAVAVKSDGKVGVSCGKDNQVRFWNVAENGKQIRNAINHGDVVWKVLFHPAKALVFTACADKSVRMVNADNGNVVKTLAGHTDQVYALALSPDGTLFASGSYNGEVRIWKADDGAAVKNWVASPGMGK